MAATAALPATRRAIRALRRRRSRLAPGTGDLSVGDDAAPPGSPASGGGPGSRPASRSLRRATRSATVATTAAPAATPRAAVTGAPVPGSPAPAAGGPPGGPPGWPPPSTGWRWCRARSPPRSGPARRRGGAASGTRPPSTRSTRAPRPSSDPCRQIHAVRSIPEAPLPLYLGRVRDPVDECSLARRSASLGVTIGEETDRRTVRSAFPGGPADLTGGSRRLLRRLGPGGRCRRGARAL